MMNKPTLLHYYITDACNARCEFCNVWNAKDPAFAKLDDVKANLIQAREAGCSFVDFTGGEPTLHPELPTFLGYAKELGFITSVTTNTLRFKKVVGDLAGKVDLLHFSIDADKPDLHDKIRGVKSWQSVMDAIPLALAHGLVPDLLFTYTEENIDSFQGLIPIAEKYRLTIILDPVFSEDGTALLSRKTNRKAESYAKHSRVYLNTAHIDLRSNGGNSIADPRCYSVKSTVVITAKNELALPCYHNREKSIPIDGGLRGRLNSRERKYYLQSEGRHNFCEGCHINCYFDPSYGYRLDRYFLKSNLSKLKYAIRKYLLDGHSLKGIVSAQFSGKKL